MFYKNGVEELRAAVDSGVEKLDELRANTTEPSFHERLEVVRRWFNDVTVLFLDPIESREMKPANQLLYLNAAALYLDIPNQLLRKMEGFHRDYGSSVMFV